ncbi:hypothetical protein, partial [Lutimonas sp.]|uniref:hypothetical protein n=1 Tax=Lutimonas sp. TaxID=1872403 RepID=UPI003C760839
MNTTKNMIQQTIFIAGALILAFMIMGFLEHADINSKEQQNELKYEGTYGLYVEKTDHYNFRWITQAEDLGFYEVLDQSKKIIATGETTLSKTHSIDLKKGIEGPLTFRFGGKNQGMHEVHL